MLNHIIEQAREDDIFSREDTPTDRRVLAGFMYHTELSFQRIEPFVDCFHIAIHDWLSSAGTSIRAPPRPTPAGRGR